MAPEVLSTTGVIARQLNRPLHRIEYVIKSRKIAPAGMAAQHRVFDEEAVRRIAKELEEMDAHRDRQVARA